MKDFGYDISDFKNIWPTFGTMDDFENMMKAAKEHNVKVLMDFVPNHSSDQHAWFKESRMSGDNDKKDWYIWRKGKNGQGGKMEPPNNWRTMFCMDVECSAWEYDETRKEYYYHQFLAAQPDLNWRNPKVVDAMHDAMRFWLDKGVSGFRVDAFAYMLESPTFADEPENPDWKAGGPVSDAYNRNLHTMTENLDGLHEILQGMQSVLQEYGKGRFMVGEIYQNKQISESDVLSYYGSKESPEFNMPYNMLLIGDLGETASLNPKKMKASIDYYDASLVKLGSWAQPNWVIGNHDVRRVRSRYGGDEYLSRCLHTLLLTLRGTPTLYNGDEFGMLDGEVTKAEAQDPTCKVSTAAWNCRDPERTPLQWSSENTNGGFSGAGVKTWLPVSKNYVKTNVKEQLGNADSMLMAMHELLALRKTSDALHSGAYKSVDHLGGDDVLAYTRTGEDGQYLVAHNFGDVNLPFANDKFAHDFKKVALMFDSRKPVTNDVKQNEASLAEFSLAGKQSLVFKVVEPESEILKIVVILLLAFATVGGVFYLFRGKKRNPAPQPSSHFEFNELKDDGYEL